MMRLILIAEIAVSFLLAGCASKPAAVPDSTPQKPTAIIEQHVTSNGIKGLFPFETNSRHLVRANMRRDESTFKGTGTFTGFIIGTRSGTEITRIDRKLKWSLNTDKQEYTECPLKGCVKPFRAQPKQATPEQKQPETRREPGCTMHIAHTSFTVKATGQKKSINGFDTVKYRAAWVVKLRDNFGRNSASTLDLDIWTTPLSSEMRDALAVEESYARALNGAVAETGKPQMIPADAAKLISAYLAGSLKPGDLKAFLETGRQMEKIKGYPISTQLAWNMEGNACAPKQTRKIKEIPSPSQTNAGDLVSGLAEIFAQKKTGDGKTRSSASEPILSFTFEVKKLAVAPVHDGEFTVPKNYRLVSQP